MSCQLCILNIYLKSVVNSLGARGDYFSKFVFLCRTQDDQETCDDQKSAKTAPEEPVVKGDQYQGTQPEPDQAQQPTVHFQTPDIQVKLVSS